MFLNSDELEQLTGYKYAKYQIRWLQENFIAFKLNGMGAPVVLRSALESAIVGNVGGTTAKPNFGALRHGKKARQQP